VKKEQVKNLERERGNKILGSCTLKPKDNDLTNFLLLFYSKLLSLLFPKINL
jgi:hypothetical protein